MFLNEPSFRASEPEWAIDESLIWLCLKQVEAWLKRRTLFPSSLLQVRHKGIHDKLVTELGLRLAFKKKNIYFFHKFYGIFFLHFLHRWYLWQNEAAESGKLKKSFISKNILFSIIIFFINNHHWKYQISNFTSMYLLTAYSS